MAFLFIIARKNVTAVENDRQGNRYKTMLCFAWETLLIFFNPNIKVKVREHSELT